VRIWPRYSYSETESSDESDGTGDGARVGALEAWGVAAGEGIGPVPKRDSRAEAARAWRLSSELDGLITASTLFAWARACSPLSTRNFNYGVRDPP
jgi:hypothetical protein